MIFKDILVRKGFEDFRDIQCDVILCYTYNLGVAFINHSDYVGYGAKTEIDISKINVRLLNHASKIGLRYNALDCLSVGNNEFFEAVLGQPIDSLRDDMVEFVTEFLWYHKFQGKVTLSCDKNTFKSKN